ncbi:YHYH protein [Winogradskyella eckloniae]|uniref:YHYH protein n=1 Tax=Winogradskyella eckloniae TaxID=1089306 RepID=UPI0015646D8D|nr:YHYH protein [Winogradskyella eckloniae]NRD19737.1 YHYH protein [Winogradskyella eckloniae]
MKNIFKLLGLMIVVFSINMACSSDDSTTSTDDIDGSDDEVVTELHAAFAEFNTDAVTVMLSDDGTEIYIETTGFPNHTSIYWETDHALYIDEPTVTKTTQDTYIGGGTGEASSFTVDATPNLTGSTVATQLNTIGIAVSGAAIFNDQEGAGDLDQAAGSLDYNGAHKGPGVYHYHLEPRSISNDDDKLVGILLDGVFIYGRRDYPSNDYPTDLDASGGHFGPTPHNPDGEYHYHIINEEYNAPLYGYDEAIVLFAGPFQGY